MSSTSGKLPFYGVIYQRGERVGVYGESEETDRDAIDRTAPVLLDLTEHTAKPKSSEVGEISRSLVSPSSLRCIDMETLAQALSRGCTICGGICRGERKNESWESQQLWCIDIDNDAATRERGYDPLPYEDAVCRAFQLGLPLVISYLTFSGNEDPTCPPEEQRYRLIFRRDTETRDKSIAAGYGAALLAAYPEADQSTVQPNRLFYGTDKEVVVWNRPMM